MKTLIAIAIVLLPGTAWAGMTCQQVFGQTQCRDDNGSTYTGQNIFGTEQWTGQVRQNDGTYQNFNQTCRYVFGQLQCD